VSAIGFRTLRGKFRLGLAVFCLLLAGAHAQVAVPPLKARVTDLTQTLSDTERQTLETKLAHFEKRKGSQIAVLIVPTVAPETIEEFSIRLAEDWKIGRQGIGDGVILVIAKNDRKMRFEIGRGLEGAIPDLAAKRIVRDIVSPHFKQQNFYLGIDAGLDWAIRLIDGESLPAAAAKPNAAAELENAWPLALVIAVVIGSILRSMFGRFVGAGMAGGLATFAFWFFAQVLWLAAVVGVVVFVLSLLVGLSGGRRGDGGGGWTSGGSGWSGGSSSGGGFSGGGGDFGGGGASGDW
jgi:uncharacterized protein